MRQTGEFLMLRKQHPKAKNELDEIYDLYNRDLITFVQLMSISKKIIKKKGKRGKKT